MRREPRHVPQLRRIRAKRKRHPGVVQRFDEAAAEAKQLRAIGLRSLLELLALCRPILIDS